MLSNEALFAQRVSGNAAFSGGRFLDAVDCYTVVISQFGGDPQLRRGAVTEVQECVFKCLSNRGICHRKLGNVEAALLDYEAALEYEGVKDAKLLRKTFLGAGLCRCLLGRHEAAKEHFMKALELSEHEDKSEIYLKLEECERHLIAALAPSSPHQAGEGFGPETPRTLAKFGARMVVKLNFTPPESEAGGESSGQMEGRDKGEGDQEPALHPLVRSLSALTLQSSPLKVEGVRDEVTGVDDKDSLRCASDESLLDGQLGSSGSSSSHGVDQDVRGVEPPLMRPAASKQRHDVDKLLQCHGSAESGLEPGSVWFLLDMQWWRAWRAHVDAESNDATPPPPPSVIDNWGLTLISAASPGSPEDSIRQHYRYARCALALRPGLQQGADFVVLPRDAWEALRTWYGGGPPLPRIADAGFSEPADLGMLPPSTPTTPSSPQQPALRSSPTARLDIYPATPPSVVDALGAGAAVGLGTVRSPTETSVLYNDCGVSRKQKLPSGDYTVSDSCFVCRRAAMSCCGRCHSVHYCSSTCQKAHWRHHKAWCAKALQHKALPFYEFQKRVPVGRRGRVGLHNLGNSCYLNSSLQCLSHIKPLTTHFLTGSYEADVNTSSIFGTRGQLVKEYAVLMQDLWFKGDVSIQPLAFKKLLGRLQPDWAGFAQQDAHEVIGFLFDKLHEDLNRVVGKKPPVEKLEGDGVNDARIAAEDWKNNSLRDDSVVRDLLSFQSRSHIECPDCGRVSITFETQDALYIPIPRSTQRTFRVLFLPLVNPSSPDAPPRPLELAVETDRLARIFALKKAVMRLLPPKTVDSASDLHLGEYQEHTHSLGRFFDEEHAVSMLREGVTIAAVVGPLLDHNSRGEDVGLCCVMQRAVDLAKATNPALEWTGFPAAFSCPPTTSCLKVRMLLWQHVSGLVRKDSPLGLLLNGATGAKLVALRLALVACLPVRIHDNYGAPFSSKRAVCDPDLCLSSNEALRALGLSMDGGMGLVGRGRLGSLLPADRQTAIGHFFSDRQICCFLSVDWSGPWMDQLDLAALAAADRHETAVAAFPAGAKEAKPSASSPSSFSFQPNRRRSLSSDQPSITLEHLLQEYTKDETLDQSEEYYCSACKEHKCARRKITLMSAQLPEVFIVNLKRFEHRDVSSLVGRRGVSYQEKIETFVDFPIEGLDLAPYCHDPHAERCTYDLFAVCNHYGRMGFGHYSAFARDWMIDGSLAEVWNSFDDNDVRPCDDASEVKSAAAYILFYKRRN